MFKLFLLTLGLMPCAQAVVIEEELSLSPTIATPHQVDESRNTIVPISLPRSPLPPSPFILFCSQVLHNDGNFKKSFSRAHFLKLINRISYEKYMSVDWEGKYNFMDQDFYVGSFPISIPRHLSLASVNNNEKKNYNPLSLLPAWKRDISITINYNCDFKSDFSGKKIPYKSQRKISDKPINNDFSFEDATDDSQWEIAGDFSKIFSAGHETILNRSFSITPRSGRYNIRGIYVYGHKDGNIVISVRMHQPAKHLIRELFQANLIDKEDYFMDFLSTDKNRLYDYLKVFVKNNLLPSLTAEKILSKLDAEQPKGGKDSALLTSFVWRNPLSGIRFDF
jgi:hypothetical protein